MADRYFFDKDGDGHWYMVPASLKAEWESGKVEVAESEWDDWECAINNFEANFDQYRTGGGINGITFENPSK